MEKAIMVILVDHRKDQATAVQKVLTTWGCLIKTRLGIHDGVLDNCSNSGLIILELVGEKDKQDQMAGRLTALPGVKVQMVRLALDA